MPDFTLPTYDEPREWIRKAREKGLAWGTIELARQLDDAGLKKFLDDRCLSDFWPALTNDEWKEIVKLQKEMEEKLLNADLVKGAAQIVGSGHNNAVKVPTDPNSSWTLYKAKLLDDGFKPDTVGEIERSTIRILKRLSRTTDVDEPIKGLVIGNVQSGKTANMAALMAMAADWGWNMFIILSGTIENLRKQTQSRLFGDLNHPGNLAWQSLEHLQRHMPIGSRAQDLIFGDGAPQRYFTVCLKNPGRLKKLIQWLQEDENAQQQMKILVIDDEADQAGINTANIDSGIRRTINKLICNLVNGNDATGNPSHEHFMAMNYIGYTATPYANVLNEAGHESLYPKDFISTLAVSNEYFGPQQIFGYTNDNVDYPGLDIVHTVTDDELDIIKNIHEGDLTQIPKSIVDSVCWFLCGTACMRIWEIKKPVSMLIHTSQKVDHHRYISETIRNWFSNTRHCEILANCKFVWEQETMFGKSDFRKEYLMYGLPDNEIFDYPDWERIQKQICIILGAGLTSIELDGSSGALKYHNGIHLCVDNSKNNGFTEDGEHIRLAYPSNGDQAPDTPAFIVIGGATLSRGLTLEGLISTFFLRSVKQADTLMQMGRWFGYRKHYELLQRVWMTERTKEQFKFLASLDQELRDEIQYMDINGISPAEYGPRVKNSPMVSFIRIVAANRMQSAEPTDLDYRGASNQTTLFDNDHTILGGNKALTESFIASLGSQTKWSDGGTHHDNVAVWKGVSFSKVKDFISNFKFQERLSVFNDTKPLLDWIEHVTSAGNLTDWNVVVCGKADDKNGKWQLSDGTEINKVSRSRRPAKAPGDTVIDIGALRQPSDIAADINLNDIKDPTIRNNVEKHIHFEKSNVVMGYRDQAGLEITPQLLIYCIDKDSKAKPGTLREDLNACEDIIGLCLYIPGGRIGKNYVATVSIKMGNINSSFTATADLEGTDAD